MAQQSRAPKQWCLSKTESITSFENWKNNLHYSLSLDPNFAPFLADDATWLRHRRNALLRGLTNDGNDVAEGLRKTAQQKVRMLNLMLGQVANYCPVISRNAIIQTSTSMKCIWQLIRAHYGFQSTGAHFLDLAEFRIESDERPEDLFQRITSFVDDNLLKSGGGITHHSEVVVEDEEISPTVENLIVLLWLQHLHKDLPRHVKQRYCTELRSRTLASIKPEISQALDSLMDELSSVNNIRVMRSDFSASNKGRGKKKSFQRRVKSCPICLASKRKLTSHFLSQCPYLPEEDRQYWLKSRSVLIDNDSDSEDQPTSEDISSVVSSKVSNRPSEVDRVSVMSSPFLQVLYNNKTVRLTLDSGATASLIKESVAKSLAIRVFPTSHTAYQADGLTHLPTVGEVHVSFSLDNRKLVFNALVVKQLGTEVLAGVPFFIQNDIGVRPAKSTVTFSDGTLYHYSQAQDLAVSSVHILRATSSQVIWPGEHLEFALVDPKLHDSTLALEPRLSRRFGSLATKSLWPSPQIISAVGDTIQIPNLTKVPQYVHKHDQFGQVMALYPSGTSLVALSLPSYVHQATSCSSSSPVQVDPDTILPLEIRRRFVQLTQLYASVFDGAIGLYNGSCGSFEATVNMGPTSPPQRKGRIPQYSRNRLMELQQKFDELESQGVFRKPEDVGIVVEYVNPSFLVNKPSGGTRLVTAFADVARYSKPSPSMMPDVESTLRRIAGWKYLIVTDLTSAFYQIPLARSSMKYCGVVTPYRGTRVYTRCAMGMPGSETALEELMCRILGDLLQDGCVVKLADDLYCGGSTPQEAYDSWKRVLAAVSPTGMHLSSHKTVICPRQTMLLGWVWSQGQLSASKHRVSTLASCDPPKTVKGLRSFMLCIDLRPMDGPDAVIRTDAAPGFVALQDDNVLKSHRLSIEIGNPKNINKNPVAERAVQELSKEIMRKQPLRGSVSPVTLSVAVNTLNSRIRSHGFSSREALLQRDQFTNEVLILENVELIAGQYRRRKLNHLPSESSKVPSGRCRPVPRIDVGDIVYLYNDRKKHQCRDRYLVMSIDGSWCNIIKFAGRLLMKNSYRVRMSDCYCVPSEVPVDDYLSPRLEESEGSDAEEEELHLERHNARELPHVNQDLVPSGSVPPAVLVTPPAAHEDAARSREDIPDDNTSFDPREDAARPREANPDDTTSFDSTPRRSSRIRKLPAHLQDYVLQ